MEKTTERPMSINEAALFLSLSKNGITLNRHKSKDGDERSIPCHRAPNGRLYYYASEINDWIKGTSEEEVSQNVKEQS